MSRNDITVSVIVPVRNAAAYLQTAIASVVAQTHRPDECIVVVGHSTDRTEEVSRSLHGVTVVTQTGEGLADARNLGIAAATGEFVTFLDADDTWSPTKTHTQRAYLTDSPECGLVAGLMIRMHEDGDDVAVPGFTPGALMARRSTLTSVGSFNNDYRIACDTDWLIRAREAGFGPTVLDHVVLHKGMRAESLSRDYPRYQAEMLRVVRGASDRADIRRGLSETS